MTPYQELEQRFHRVLQIEDITTILAWDNATVMPPGGTESRAEQLATLRLIALEILSEPSLEELFDQAEDQSDLGEWERANLREMRRRRIHATAVPADLVAALARAIPKCEMTWRKARAEDDFASLVPALREVLRLTRESAAAKGERLGCSAYDALLDENEPGMKVALIDPLFDDLAGFLPDFLERVLERQASLELHSLRGPFPVNLQEDLSRRFMSIAGFDFEAGRLDVSTHPMSCSVHGDARITTRYSPDDFTQSLMATLHETGHAQYDRGLSPRWHRQPVGRYRGTSVHESQSLLVEMQVCRSREFLAFAAPIIRETFGGQGDAWSAENLYRIYTRVQRGYIRVEADEVTYPVHVILRYRLERAMVKGDLDIADLPGAWNEEMRKMLGTTPPNDRVGCLQDVHWPDGAFGYFPMYTIGALTAAQLMDALRSQDESVMSAVGQGNFAPLFSWLRENVHGKSSLYPTEELIERASGKPLGVETFKAHLRRRYLES